MEGGLMSWKIQKVDTRRGPAGDYQDLRRPLPPPPKDMHWIQDLDTHEWHLTKIQADNGETTDSKNVEILEATAVVEGKTLEDGVTPVPDFLEHTILPTDTFQGICLRYKITPLELRRANGGLTSNNLTLMPSPLLIPMDPQAWRQLRAQGEGEKLAAAAAAEARSHSPEVKIQRLRRKFPKLAATEARCYLELNDWNLDEATKNAMEDGF